MRLLVFLTSMTFLTGYSSAEDAVEHGPAHVTVQKIDNGSAAGRLVELSNQAAVIDTDTGNETFDPAQLLQIGFEATKQVAPDPKLEVELLDGSRVQASAFSVTGKEAAIEHALGARLKLPAALVTKVHVPFLSDEEREQWRQIEKLTPATDIIVIRKKDALDYLEGVIQDISTQQVRFEVDGEVLPVKWTKVFGLNYYRRRSVDPPPAICRVYDHAGSELAATAVQLAGNQLRITLVSGADVELPLDTVRRLDYSQGKVLYLSDIDWEIRESRRTAFFGPPGQIDDPHDLFTPQRDRAMDGGELRLDDKPYAKGLALHSRTRLVYRLPEGFQRFNALAGIDDRMEHHGDVQLTIEGDGRQLFEASISGVDPPRPIDLNISNVKRLAIEVDFGSEQDLSDHLDLCDARIIR